MIAIDDLKDLAFDATHVKGDSPIEVVGDIAQVRYFIPAMLGYCRRHPCRAVAAPRFGYNWRVIVSYVAGDYGRIFINPVLVGYGDFDEAEKKHEHVSIHALNLKDEQFLLNTESGYYQGRESVGLDMAYAMQEAYEWLC